MKEFIGTSAEAIAARDQALGSLCIVGNIPERLDPEGLFTFLAEKVPTVMLRQTKQLIFRPFCHEEELFRVKGGIQRGRFIGGNYTGRAQAAQVNTKPKRIETPERLKHVVAHELGHGLMMTGLFWSELSDFNAVRHVEPVHVTEYMAWIAENYPSGRLIADDFAETVALLLTVPDQLNAIAPSRYRAMSQILAAHA